MMDLLIDYEIPVLKFVKEIAFFQIELIQLFLESFFEDHCLVYKGERSNFMDGCFRNFCCLQKLIFPINEQIRISFSSILQHRSQS